MGWNDRLSKNNEYKETCLYCKMKFTVTEVPQEPGFRMRDQLRCPFCDRILRYSMSVEFYVTHN